MDDLLSFIEELKTEDASCILLMILFSSHS